LRPALWHGCCLGDGRRALVLPLDRRADRDAKPEGGIDMPGTEQESLVRRFVDEVWNQGNTAAIEEIYAPDVVEHADLPFDAFGQDQGAVIGLYGGVVTPIEQPAREGLKHRVMSIRTAMPDLKMTVDNLSVEGDKVRYGWTMRGTHSGPFREVGPTNKQVTVTGTTTERFDGKIVERWVEADLGDMMKQLGVDAPQKAKSKS
jgi:predicted ester cyclase